MMVEHEIWEDSLFLCPENNSIDLNSFSLCGDCCHYLTAESSICYHIEEDKVLSTFLRNFPPCWPLRES